MSTPSNRNLLAANLAASVSDKCVLIGTLSKVELSFKIFLNCFKSLALNSTIGVKSSIVFLRLATLEGVISKV